MQEMTVEIVTALFLFLSSPLYPLSSHRAERGQSILRELLGPLVKEVLDEKDLVLHTGPVDVYRAWINQMETQTGEPT